MKPVANSPVRRLAKFGLTTQNIDRLVRFFVLAFDCREVERQRRSGSEFERLMGIRGGATSVTLQLGDARTEILEFDRPGSSYVSNLSAYDNQFQHFALVCENMSLAYSRLSSVAGWSSISTAGPQQLPASAGGVKAFKFRDPDGHPLELLSFPPGETPPHWRNPSSASLFLGIDHSAVSCSNARASIDFYQKMGLSVVAKSINQGIEQELLDGIPAPQVDVITLAPPNPTPHIELLCYRNRGVGRTTSIQSNDIAATRLILECDTTQSSGAGETLVFDPDGHHLIVTSVGPCIPAHHA